MRERFRAKSEQRHPALRRRPTLAFLTTVDSEGPWPHIAKWLASGCERAGIPLDIVYTVASRGTTLHRGARVFGLGRPRSRGTTVAIARYLRSRRPALALATPGTLAPFAVAAGILARQPVVPWEPTFSDFGLEDLPRSQRALPLLQRLLYPHAVGVAAVSQDVRDHLRTTRGIRIAPSRTFVIPNPVDADEIRARAGSANPSGSRFRYCSLGRLAREKGFDILIRAAALAQPELGEDWEIRILGKGPMRAELEQLVRACRVERYVKLAGYVTNPLPILRGSDVYVHPARWEGFGMAIAEALSLERAVIATNCPGGPRELLGEGAYGELVPPDDPAALAQALVQYRRDDALRARREATAAESMRRYAPDRIVGKIERMRAVLTGES